jgi:hypothetical protein
MHHKGTEFTKCFFQDYVICVICGKSFVDFVSFPRKTGQVVVHNIIKGKKRPPQYLSDLLLFSCLILRGRFFVKTSFTFCFFPFFLRLKSQLRVRMNSPIHYGFCCNELIARVLRESCVAAFRKVNLFLRNWAQIVNIFYVYSSLWIVQFHTLHEFAPTF